MRRLLLLVLIAGLAYGGLYIHYGVAVTQAIDERLDDYGLSTLEIEHVDYGLLAPLSTRATVSADILYRGTEATIAIRIQGHPLFSDEMRLELEGLQALRLMIRPRES